MENFKARAWDSYKKEMYSFEELGLMEERNEISFHTLLDGGYSDFKVQLYSGMKDLQGNEIYEGDILHLDSHQDMKVEFKDGCFIAISTNRIQELNWMPTALNVNILLGYKVISNIYENPELLEV